MQQTLFNADEKQKTIADLFNAGKVLTTLEAFYLAHTTQLPKFVSNLRKAGMQIKDKWEGQYPNLHKVYWLEKEEN